MILGIGTDLVAIPEFARQMSAPGTQFGNAFSPAEHRAVARRARETGDEGQHFAARWAAKEAFVKAWSAAVAGKPPVVDPATFPWGQVEVSSDAWGRPALRVSGQLWRQVVASTLPGEVSGVRAHLSLSHDGAMATAVVILERVE